MKKILLLSLLVLLSCEKDPIKYSLSVLANPIEGGIVNPATGNYEAGERVTIINQASNYFSFKNWSGDWSGTTSQIIITMDGDKSIVANFEKIDDDEDGVLNQDDICGNTPAGISVDSTGCAASQRDTDGDGVSDDLDLCDNSNISSSIIDSNGCDVPLFYLADNGITIKAIDEAEVGMYQEFQGNVHHIVSEEQLRAKVDMGQSISYLVTSKITDLSGLFQSNTYVNASITSWDVSNVTDMSFMFAGSTQFNQDISNWDVSNVTNMRGMFYSIPISVNLTNIDDDNLLHLKYPYMASSNNIWNEINNQHNLQTVLSPWLAVYAGPSNQSEIVDLGTAVAIDAKTYLNDYYTNSVTELYVKYANDFGLPFSIVSSGLPAIGLPSLSSAIVSAVNSVLNIIVNEFNSYEPSFSLKFNQDVSNWDVSNVNDMSYMFGGSIKFNQDISNWNVSNVNGCSGFSINNKSWSLSKPDFTNCNPQSYVYLSDISIFEGNYERNPIENDWHQVQISINEGNLIWTNNAQWSWSLEIIDGELYTKADCPYGVQKITVMFDSSNNVSGLMFNSELYEKI